MNKLITEQIENILTNKEYESTKAMVGMQLVYAPQASCYLTQAADVISKFLLLPRDSVLDVITKNTKVYKSLVNLKLDTTEAIFNIKKKKGGIYDVCALITGSQIIDRDEVINEDGTKQYTTRKRQINPQIAREFLKHITNPETGIDVSKVDLTDEDTVPIIKEVRRETRLIPKTERERIEAKFDKQQRAAFDTLMDKENRIVSLGGAVRCGKTYLATYASIRYMEWLYSTPIEEIRKLYPYDTVQDREKGQIVFLGKTAPSVFQNIFAGVISTFKLNAKLPAARAFLWNVLNFQVKIGGYGTISLKGLKGITTDHIHVDEAENCDEKEFIENVITRISNPWSKLFVVWNPKTPAHFLSKIAKNPKEHDFVHFNFNLLECEFADPKYVQMLIKNFGEGSPIYKRYILGIPASVSGSVYSMFKEDVHTFTPADRVKSIKKYNKIFVGMDEGTRSPKVYTAIGIYEEDETIKCDVIDELYYPRGHGDHKTYQQYARELEIFLDQFGDKLERVYVPHDAGRAKSELKAQGVPVASATRKTNVISGIRMIQSMFTKGILKVDSGCKNLIQELFLYQYKDESEEDEIEKINDHACDALRYAIVSSGVFTKKAKTSDEKFEEIYG